MPKVELRPVTPPKFIRDQIHHDDIEGSKPRKPTYYETRHHLQIGDIEGCKPRDRTFNRTTHFDAINYKDVTHAEFKTKRTTNPLSPSYVFRNDEGRLEEIGNIEGNCPMKIPERLRGPVSTSLDTADIEGAQSSTKGLGVFAHHSRKEFRKTNDINDIAGCTVGSLRKGVATNRFCNPLNPDYEIPGHTEYGENSGFGAVGKEVIATSKPRLPTQPPRNSKPPIKFQNNVNREGFKRDIGAFYGTEDKNFADIDFNKLYKATKDTKSVPTCPGIPENKKSDINFKRDMKMFYDQPQNDESEFNYEQNKFYEDTMDARPTDPNKFSKVVQHQHSVPAQIEVNPNSQHYKRAQAQFYGENYNPSDKSSDRGSIFQENAAHFFGEEGKTASVVFVTNFETLLNYVLL